MANYATVRGFLLVLAIVLPISGALLSLVLGGRHTERVVLILMPAGLTIAVVIGAAVWSTHNALQYLLATGRRRLESHIVPMVCPRQ